MLRSNTFTMNTVSLLGSLLFNAFYVATTKTPAPKHPCLEAWAVAQFASIPYVAECQDNGDYKTRRCLPLTDHCWCVNAKTGERIEGTDSTTKCEGETSAETKGRSSFKKCVREKQEAQNSPLGGIHVPGCNERGDYESVQCELQSSSCWCANQITGQKIEGSETPFGVQPNCELIVTEVSKCQRHRRVSQLRGSRSVHFVPECKENGDYADLQCVAVDGGSDRNCWCVNSKTGEKKTGTEQSYSPNPNCPSEMDFIRLLFHH